MSWKTAISFTLTCALTTACGTDVVGLDANDAHNVSISVDVPGFCIFGGCDPVNADARTLALIRIRNVGTTAAYLHACGSQVALEEQQLVRGDWVNVGPAGACALPSTPIQLAGGDSLRFNGFYASGTRRLVLGVGVDGSLLDEAPATSAAFIIH